jgi:hypothetical protein
MILSVQCISKRKRPPRKEGVRYLLTFLIFQVASFGVLPDLAPLLSAVAGLHWAGSL